MNTSDQTDDVSKRRARLTGVAVISVLVTVPALAAWLVNIEVAVKTLVPGWSGLLGDTPGGLPGLLVALSGDLSTISTLVPLMLFAFPLVQCLRILRRPYDDTASIHAMEALPYPAHFPFFLVMLGLTGTLYGLWIGLSVSGVSAMTKGMPAAEDLPVVLERLLDGTATALLSSLVGLIGAFLAAKPFPFLFQRAACLEPVEEERSLAETIDHLTRDLKALSAASREFSTCLQPETVTRALTAIGSMEEAVNGQTQAIQDTLGAITSVEGAVKGQTETLRGVAQSMEQMTEGQRESLQWLQKLDGIAEAVSQTGHRFDQAAGLFEKMITTELRVAETLNSLLGEVQAERRESSEHLTALRAAIENEATDARSERSQLRKAFAAYVGGASRGDA